jgi:hypothetical protein
VGGAGVLDAVGKTVGEAGGWVGSDWVVDDVGGWVGEEAGLDAIGWSVAVESTGVGVLVRRNKGVGRASLQAAAVKTQINKNIRLIVITRS